MIKPYTRMEAFRDIAVGGGMSLIMLVVSLFSAGKVSCGGPLDLLVEIDTIDNNTQFAVCIVDGIDDDGKALYTVDSVPLTEEQRSIANQARDGFSYFRIMPYIANFKVTDGAGQVVTEFPQGIVLYIAYTDTELQDIKKNRGYFPPRAAVLDMGDDNLSAVWEELGGIYKELGPDDLPFDGFENLLEIFYYELPDPLIGGC